MARLIVSTVVGVAVGYITGNPQAGFAAFSATYGATGFLEPAQQVKGPRIDDLKGTTAQYGTAIPQIYGHPRVAGAIVWSSDKHTIANTESAGGKGGPSTEVTTYTYTIDVRILLSANVIGGVRRVWSNGKLVWSIADDATGETIAASGETDAWERMTVYTGAADQMPDPVEEAALGVANCPAYRGRGSVFIEGLNLGGSGYLPNLTFEIGEPAPVGEAPSEVVYEVETDGYGSLQIGVTTYDPDGYLIYAEKTTTSPDTQWIYAFGTSSTVPAMSQLDLSGVGLTSGGVTPIGGASDVDSLVFNVNTGGAHAYYGGSIYRHYDVTGGDAYTYLVEGDYIWISTTGNAVFRFAKTGGAPDASNTTTAAQCRTLAKVGSILYGAGIDGFLYAWNSTTLAQIGNWPLDGGSDKLLCTDGTRLFDIANSATAAADVLEWNTGTESWDVFCSDLGEEFSQFNSGAGNFSAPVYRDPYIYATRMSGTTLKTMRVNLTPRAQKVPAALEDVLEDLAVRSGLSPSYLDFSSCAGKVVRALAVSQVTPARTVMQMLGDANMQEFVESGGVLKTVARGGASVATLTYDKLGASAGDPVEPLPLRRLNDIELPRQVAITYQNTLNDYQNGTEYSDRLLGGSTSVSATELALGMEPQEAKRLADFKLTDAVAGITQIGPLGITREYARLEPCDVITVTDHTGSTFRTRILKITDDGGLRTLECVLDDASAVNSEAVTDEGYESSTIVRAVQSTDLELIDGPIFRDADNVPMIYAAVNRSSLQGSWPGSALFRGVNDTGWSEVARFTDRTYVGTTTTDLPAWTGGWLSDESSGVTVSGVGTLQSYTDDAILNGTASAYLIGSEVLYARNATLVSEGVYTLTGLYRGRRGTEWAAEAGSAAGSRVVLIQAAGLRRVDFDSGQLGSEFDFRAVTLGKAIGSATTESITPMGIGLKPFAPVHLEADDNGDGTYDVTWQRRTRLSCRFGGSLGINTPLGEASESYAVEVSDGVSVTSTQTVASESATVTASPGDVVRVYQVSAIVGRGYVAEVTL